MIKRETGWRKKRERQIPEGYVSYVRRLLERQCPYEEKELKRMVRQTAGAAVRLGFFSGSVVLLWNVWLQGETGWYGVACMLLGFFVCCLEYPELRVQRLKERVSWQTLAFFEQVKHRYLSVKNVPAAIEAAAEEAPYEMKLLAKRLCGLLTESNRREKIRQYVISGEQNKYWKLFLVQAYHASERGDTMSARGVSLFSENVEHLRLELMQEIYDRKKRFHEFSGYSFVALAPVFALPLLRSWAEEFTDQLADFYRTAGNGLALLGMLAGIGVYAFVRWAKQIGIYENRVVLSTRFERLPFARKLLREAAGEEVRRFQSVLLMERRFPEVQVIGLLEDMEAVSVVFGEVLRTCINAYPAGQRKALLTLKKEGERLHPAFREIADSFLAVDEVGIPAAFAEAESNRTMLEKMEQLEAEIRLEQKKGDLGLSSKLPTLVIVGGYFIAPLFVYSLHGVGEMFRIIEELRP